MKRRTLLRAIGAGAAAVMGTGVAAAEFPCEQECQVMDCSECHEDCDKYCDGCFCP